MKKLVYILCCIFSLNCFAKTKLPPSNCRPGNPVRCPAAVGHGPFSINNSNFGQPTQIFILKVDSVILLTEDKIIILRKSYEGPNGSTPRRLKVVYRDTLHRVFEGRFFAIKSIDSLRMELRKRYRGFRVDSTVFVGFNKKIANKKKPAAGKNSFFNTDN